MRFREKMKILFFDICHFFEKLKRRKKEKKERKKKKKTNKKTKIKTGRIGAANIGAIIIFNHFFL